MFLQESLSTMDSRIVDMIFDALYGFVFDIMSDQFRCHVFAKLIESCNCHQLRLITLKVTSPSQDDLFLKASLNKRGSGTIKKLIKVLSRSPLILTGLYQRLVVKLKEHDLDSIQFGYGKNVVKLITGYEVPVPQLGF
ncbi:hypothetical protein ACOSQ4_006429 [Xanthoceras sorbifolium]